jgi:hypothetical protein
MKRVLMVHARDENIVSCLDPGRKETYVREQVSRVSSGHGASPDYLLLANEAFPV